MALRNSRGLPTHQLSCPLSLPSDFAFCLRVRRRGGVKLQGNATTNSFMSDASIVNFFATMIGTLIIDILLVDKFFNVSVWPVVLCGINARTATPTAWRPVRSTWRRQLFWRGQCQAAACVRMLLHRSLCNDHVLLSVRCRLYVTVCARLWR